MLAKLGIRQSWAQRFFPNGDFLFWKMDGEVERLEMRRTISLLSLAINAASDDDDDVGCQSDSRAQQF